MLGREIVGCQSARLKGESGNSLSHSFSHVGCPFHLFLLYVNGPRLASGRGRQLVRACGERRRSVRRYAMVRRLLIRKRELQQRGLAVRPAEESNADREIIRRKAGGN